jgi:hypothetical protein
VAYYDGEWRVKLFQEQVINTEQFKRLFKNVKHPP